MYDHVIIDLFKFKTKLKDTVKTMLYHILLYVILLIL
jgi:hypothetical protein